MSDLLKKLNKDYKEVASYGDTYPKADFISSGIYKFDAVSGGGFARGHCTEIYGAEGAGKSAFSYQAIGYAQSQGMMCALVDAEGRFNPDRAEALGVKIKKLIIIRPDYGEQACEVMRDIIESGEVDLLVLDSLAALSSKSETQSVDGGGQMANQAKMWAQFTRKVVQGFKSRKTALLVINQVRVNIAINQYAPGAKDPYTLPGGKAQAHFASNRVEIKKLEKQSEFGYKVKFKSSKTSFTRPFMEMETFFDWEKGFSIEADILELAIDNGVIVRDGASYSLDGKKIAHGEKKMRALMDDPIFSAKLTEALTNEAN